MKNLTLLLATTLLAASSSQSESGLHARYDDPSARMSMTVSHDITVVRTPNPDVKARRDFAFDLALAPGGEDVITVTIDGARGTYEAHSQQMRLGTRHLTGKSFALTVAGGGRRIETAEPESAPAIDLGPPVTEAFSVAGVLNDTLPRLPEQALAVGTTWTTGRDIRSLEGWVWTTGRLESLHEVIAIDREAGRTIVSVSTEGVAKLAAASGKKPASATLERTLHWTFDATAGRLLTMSMEQTTEGISTVPQGEIRVRQLTRVELAPRDS